MAEKVYEVTGMTCGHCVSSVTSEISKVVGVDSVEVDLGSSRVTVAGDGFNDEQIRAAVDEAGYAITNA